MRRYQTLLCLLFAATAYAEELYIVPAYARSMDRPTQRWSSRFVLTNPYDHPVNLRIIDSVGENQEFACRFPEIDVSFPSVLRPGETRFVCMPFAQLGAFSFVADAELVVTSEILHIRLRPSGEVSVTRQSVELGRKWIEAGETAMIVQVPIDAETASANLFITNPDAEEISVTFSVIRTAQIAGYTPFEPYTQTVRVPARSLGVYALREAPRIMCFGAPCGNPIEHTVTLRGTARFFAATSSVESGDDAVFRVPFLPR